MGTRAVPTSIRNGNFLQEEMPLVIIINPNTPKVIFILRRASIASLQTNIDYCGIVLYRAHRNIELASVPRRQQTLLGPALKVALDPLSSCHALGSAELKMGSLSWSLPHLKRPRSPLKTSLPRGCRLEV